MIALIRRNDMRILPLGILLRLSKLESLLKMWIVDHLPRWVIYYSIVKAGVYACSGKYSKQVLSQVTLIQVMRRWEAGK